MAATTIANGLSVTEILKSDSLPSLPAVAIKVVRLCRDPDVDVGELAQTLAMDPTLASKLLKLANSPKYCRREPMTNIERACVVLGLKTLKIMSLSFSLTQATVKDANGAKSFDFHEYWHHCICQAALGRDFARLVNQPFQDEAFFCGLVGRIGQLAMASAIPTEYNDVATLSSTLPDPLREIEFLGFDHHEVGGRLLEKWGLPDLLVDAVRNWSEPDEESENVNLCRIIKISDLLATVICAKDKGRAYAMALELALQYFGLSAEEIDELVASSKEHIESLASVLDIKIEQRSDFEALIAEARLQTIDVALDVSLEVDDLKSRQSELVIQTEQLQRKAEVDALTGISNRGEFDKKFANMLTSRKQGQVSASMAVLMIDVDHFKSFNDTHGHLAGDAVLRDVAKWMKESLRPSDFIARYGGEEFAIVLPNVDCDAVEVIAERVRVAIESGTVEFDGLELKVTASIGAAVVDRVSESLTGHDFVKVADECLYQSKEAGRNQVHVRKI